MKLLFVALISAFVGAATATAWPFAATYLISTLNLASAWPAGHASELPPINKIDAEAFRKRIADMGSLNDGSLDRINVSKPEEVNILGIRQENNSTLIYFIVGGNWFVAQCSLLEETKAYYCSYRSIGNGFLIELNQD